MGFWLVVHLALQVFGLVHIARNRHSMATRVVVKWTLLLVFVPIFGVIGYISFLVEGACSGGLRAVGTKRSV